MRKVRYLLESCGLRAEKSPVPGPEGGDFHELYVVICNYTPTPLGAQTRISGAVLIMLHYIEDCYCVIDTKAVML